MTYIQRRKPHMVAAIKYANEMVPSNIKKREGRGRSSQAWTEEAANKWNTVYHTELERSWQCSTR